MNPLPLEIGGEYNLIIEDKNNQLNYQITNVDQIKLQEIVKL